MLNEHSVTILLALVIDALIELLRAALKKLREANDQAKFDTDDQQR